MPRETPRPLTGFARIWGLFTDLTGFSILCGPIGAPGERLIVSSLLML